MGILKTKFKEAAVLMAAAMLVSGFGVAHLTVNAQKVTSAAGDTIVSDVGADIRERICEEIKKTQDTYYDGVYAFENWKFTFENETMDGNTYGTDVYASADMTLIRPYDQSPYYQGIMSAYDNTDIRRTRDAAAIEAEAEQYKSLVEEYYLQPYETGFVYHAEVSEAADGISIQLYRGVNQGESYSWEKVEETGRFCDLATYERGAEAARMAVEQQADAVTSRASSGYRASGAVTYARAHATDEPEFSGDGNSDCANFVSKCIHAGGIPTDTAGEWYPAKTWGDVWGAGDNWRRTGFYPEMGGIKIYFTNKGYISEVPVSSVSIGCIMYWNDHSHVAMVTYYDGNTIKYSDHSNVKKDSTYHTYTTEDVTFYQFN
ncbi:MAG: amidase domain-containing protein [Bacteroidales bacterium]|nr:amidase domain-containing protein [Lachnoclostridium sp.]MCM1385093.1 amidase domain-containing protein [Lachnoclostridium sp.]MCM1466060.1 amidase domain-containing protein [Bacteroidales bacterium]